MSLKGILFILRADTNTILKLYLKFSNGDAKGKMDLFSAIKKNTQNKF